MNQLKTTLLLSLLTVLMVLMGGAMGGKSGMYMAFFMAAGMNFFSYWFSDKIVLKMYGAQRPGNHPRYSPGFLRHGAQTGHESRITDAQGVHHPL